jgi:DNA-binding XRE family transcriptional regulator
MIKAIEGFPKYAVSDDGSVYRIDVDGEMREKTASICTRGYRQVHLNVATSVSKLVCEAFHGPRPPGYVAWHIDRDKLNDRADNLEWISRKECRDRSIIGGKTGEQRERIRAERAKALADKRAIRPRLRKVFPVNFYRILCAGGMNRRQFAIKIGMAGPHLYNLSNGKLAPNYATLSRIAAALGVPVSELVKDI